jgi:hypothetical protein
MSPYDFDVAYETSGRLGIEFESMSSPFIVKTSVKEGVIRGDVLLSIKNSSGQNILDCTASECTWNVLVNALKNRPVQLTFRRDSDDSTVSSTPSFDSNLTVSFEKNEPLGLEFASFSFPWEIAEVEGQAKRAGVRIGTCVLQIGEKIIDEKLSWTDLKSLLVARPVKLVFGARQPPHGKEQTQPAAAPPQLLPQLSPAPITVPATPQLITVPAPENLSIEISRLKDALKFSEEQVIRLSGHCEAMKEELEDYRIQMETKLSEKVQELQSCKIQLELSRKEDPLPSNNNLSQHPNDDLSLLISQLQEKDLLLTQLKSDNSELKQTSSTILSKLQTVLEERPLYLEKRIFISEFRQFLKSSKETADVIKFCDRLGLLMDERKEILNSQLEEQ